MIDFHKQVPGDHFETTYFLAHHGRSIARWNMLDRSGHKISDGVSYGEYGPTDQLVVTTLFLTCHQPHEPPQANSARHRLHRIASR